MNLVMVTGRLATDPQRKTAKNNKTYTFFRFVAEGDYRGPNAPRKIDYVSVIGFGRIGEGMYARLRKGMRTMIRGKISTTSTYDAYGQKRERTYITASTYEMIDSRFLQKPIEDLRGSDGELLIPREVTESLEKAVSRTDEDMPEEYAEGSLDDSL